MKRMTLIYLATYLLAGGAAFAFFPGIALKLFFSTGHYDDVMIRVSGMFMLTLSGLIAMMARNRDYTYYGYTIVARTFITCFLIFLLASTQDPMFAILIAVVLSGLLPSYYVFITERRSVGS